MSYSYMKHHYGDNCFYGDTDYKRYARYHMPRGGDINIFNVGGCYPSMMPYCCGSGWLSGANFGTGFGIGLGMGLGNLLMGGFNMLNCWLGSGMNWGNGLGMMPSINGGRRGKTELEAQPVRGNQDNVGDEPEADQDYGAINEILGRQPEDSNKPDGKDKDQVEAWNAQIQSLIDQLSNYEYRDQIDNEKNLKQITNAKAILELAKVDFVEQIGNEELTNALSDIQKSDNLETLILHFNELTSEQKESLKVSLENELVDLKDQESYKPSEDYTKMLQLELLCKINPNLVVNVEYYADASDNWIKGSISNVKMENGKLTYWVNCKDTGEEIKANWKFEVQENAQQVKIVGTITNDNSPEYMARIGMTYTLGENGYYINNNGRPTATRR